MTAEELVSSGMLEQYVLGQLPEDRAAIVRAARQVMPEVRQELEAMERTLELLASGTAVQPPPTLRSVLMRAIDQDVTARAHEDRPPVLHPGSRVADYQRWIDRRDMVEDPENRNIHFVPFAMNDDGVSAMVWMRQGAEEEVHTDCVEKFLIIDGACDIRIGDRTHPMKAGDYMSIPMHVPHAVKVTSAEPCRIIIQRIAA